MTGYPNTGQIARRKRDIEMALARGRGVGFLSEKWNITIPGDEGFLPWPRERASTNSPDATQPIPPEPTE